MACENCTDNQNIGWYPNTQGCVNCPAPCPDGCDVKDASCILYTSAPLTCIEAESNTNLEVILQKIDAKVCQTSGNYTGFNFYCLTDTGPINNEQQFVERISNFVCQLRTDLNTFTTVTFPTSIANLQGQIAALNAPNITSCPELNIVQSDSQNTVLTKLSNSVCSLYGAINPSSANWDQCFTLVGDPPSTIVEGFNTILNQICSIKSSGNNTLPTFDNTGSCLSSPTTTDSLVDTISKIKARLCSTPTFYAGNLSTHICSAFNADATLETVLSSILTQVDTVSSESVRAYTSDFLFTNIDDAHPCLGKRIGLNLSNIDRNVAATSSDPTPGTLFDKLQAGSNFNLDYTTIPGKVILNSSTGAVADEKVKVNSVDSAAGYLQDKLIGSTDIVSVAVTPTNGDTQLRITSNLDMAALINEILDQISDDEDLKSKFCSLISSCPSPCDPPTNVQIIPA
jgi:hypothetical protein